MQDIAPAVYTIAFLVNVLCFVDFVVHRRNVSFSTFGIQLFCAILFIVCNIVLVVFDQQEARVSLLYAIQGSSLCQSLISEALISLRMYTGFDRSQRYLEVHLISCVISAGLCIWGFTAILIDTSDIQSTRKGCILILVGTNVAHAFLTWLAILLCATSVKFSLLLANVNCVIYVSNTLCLLLQTPAFLLGQTITNFLLNALWIIKTAYGLRGHSNKSTSAVELQMPPSTTYSNTCEAVDENAIDAVVPTEQEEFNFF